MANYPPNNLSTIKIPRNIPKINLMDFSFANNSSDEGYNSTNHHSTVHDFSHNFIGSVLQKIDEDIENNSMNKKLPSPVVTPTTASIKRMNSLNLSSPQIEATSLLRVPQKRSATKTQPDNFQCTPKKSKVPSGNENIHNGVITPIRSFGGDGGDTNILMEDKRKSTGLNLISSNIVTNVLKEKSINRMPLPRSLSTSTPKFSPNIRVYDFNQKNVPKSTSPCKKKRILKKFQSFSPISYLKNSCEQVIIPNNEIELVKKRLSFVPDRGENTINRKRPKLARQRAIVPEESPPDPNNKIIGDVAKKLRKVDSLKAITEECDNNTSYTLDLPRNATLENDTWRDFSLSNNTLNTENVIFSNLINAPILNLGCASDNKIQHKLNEQTNQINNSQSSFTQLSSIEAADSLFNDFIEHNSCEEISVPSIHSYFDALKNTSLNHSGIKEKSQLLPIDSLDFLNDGSKNTTVDQEDILRSPKRRDSLSLIESFITPKKSNYEFNSVEYEKNLILHPKLPKTPPKKTKTLKRLNSTKFSLSERKKIARTSYEGIDRLNILAHLENIKPALDIIFNNLTGEDLVRVSMVSKKWKHIVDSNNKALEKKMEYLKTAQPVKENIKKHSFSTDIIGKPSRAPFTLNNCSFKNRSKIQVSPSRSPSKFNENQMLVKNLRKDSKLSRCPRCNSFCEVILPQVPTSPITCRKPYKSPRKCLFSLQDTPTNVKRASSFSAFEKRNEFPKQDVTRSNSWCPIIRDRSVKGNKSFFNISALTSSNSFCSAVQVFDSMILPIIDDHTLNDGIMVNSNTAICDKCGFIFCNRCSNENHPNKNCSEIGSLSPERDNDNRPVKISVIGSKQSKRNLKRL